MLIFHAFLFSLFAGNVLAKQCATKKSNSKLICYYSELTDVDFCLCSHVILPANSDAKGINAIKEKFQGIKVLLAVNEFNENLVNLVKNSSVDGLEINLKQIDSKTDISDFISTIKDKLVANLYLAISVPAKADILAKYYDFGDLQKVADLFILQTNFLGASTNVTFHPSRLSGLWDMQNTDSVVDLVNGLGAPLSKLVLVSPVQAFEFTLQNESYTAPGSPALEVVSLTRNELCQKMSVGNWTLERDEDLTGPYIFRKNKWIAFEDSTSIDIKAKYARVRGLAGLALKDLSQDGGTKCGPSLLQSAFEGLTKQARAPRGAVLQSLEREILDSSSRPLDSVQLSPYRITRVVDVAGNFHTIRQDTRTEFECSRQGYFVHPRSCGRFYRCVKFNQLSDEYSVFEFDCPAGLAFDSRYEVCVWPGSLPHASPCSGSSEIAPVPRERFVCPGDQGYYADPENCRWFFACLDHGKSPLSAYEFRCPYGLVFDQDRLVCEWPWMVPKCTSGYSTVGSVGLQQSLLRYDGLGPLSVVQLGGLSTGSVQPTRVYSSLGHQENAQHLGLGAFGKQGAQQVVFHANAGQGRNQFATGFNGISSASQTLSHDGQYDIYGRAQGNSGYGGGRLFLQNYFNNAAGGQGIVGTQYYQPAGFAQGASGYAANGKTGYFSANQQNGEYSSGAHAGVNLNKEQIHDSRGEARFGQNIGIVGVTANLDYNQQQRTNIASGEGQNFGAISVSPLPNIGIQSGFEYDQQQKYNSAQSGVAYDEANRKFSQSSAGGTLAGQFVEVSSVHPPPAVDVRGGFAYQQDNRYHTGQDVGISAIDYNQNYRDHNYRFAQEINREFDGGGQIVEGVNVTPLPTVDVVGGGISAVLAHNAHSGSQYGSFLATPIPALTISPPSPTPVIAAAPVPVVTSTPSYEGGVIANVPRLQYKLVTPSVNFHGASDFGNYSQGLNYISSTLVPPVGVLRQPYAADGGYSYSKPSVGFEEGRFQNAKSDSHAIFHGSNVGSYVPVTTPSYPTFEPLVPSVHVTPPAPVAIESKGYEYPKPAVQFVEAPQVIPVQPVVKVTPPPPPARFVQHQSPPVVQITPPPQLAVQPVLPVTLSPPVTTPLFIPPVVAVTPATEVRVQPVQKIVQITPPPLAPKIVHPVVLQPPRPSIISSFSIHNEPAPILKLQPLLVPPQPVQPSAVSAYSFQNSSRSYDYNNQYRSHSYGSVYAPQPVQPVVSIQQAVPQQIGGVHYQTRHFEHVPQSVISKFSFGTAIGENHRAFDWPVPEYPVQRLEPVQPQISPVQVTTPLLPIVQHPPIPKTYLVSPPPQPAFRFQEKVQVQPVVQIAAPVPVPVVHPAVRQQTFQHHQQFAVQDDRGFIYNKQTPSDVDRFRETLGPIVVTQKVEPIAPVTTAVPILQHQVVNLQQHHAQNYNQQFSDEGFIHTKQTQKFEPIVPVVTAVPLLQKEVVDLQPIVQQHAHTYNQQFSAENNEGFIYTKQTPVRFQERLEPIVVTQNVEPIIQVTTAVPTLQKQVQPIVHQHHTQTYNQQLSAEHNEGFIYTKQTPYNAVRFQEKLEPIVVTQKVEPIVPFTTAVPILQKQVVNLQPIVQQQHTQTYNRQFAVNDGFVHSKQTPKVVYIENYDSRQPVVQQASFISGNAYRNQSFQNNAEEYRSLSRNPIVVQPEGYYYPKPAIKYEDDGHRQPVQEEPFVARTAYVTGNRPKPVIIESYSQVVTTPKPIGVVYTQSQKSAYNQEDYRKRIDSDVYISSPTPFVKVTPKPKASQPQRQGHYHYYDSRVQSTVPPTRTPQNYLPPTTIRYYLPPTGTTPAVEYLPSTTKQPPLHPPTREYLPSTTPSKEYLPSTSAPPRDYLPPRTKEKYVATTRRPITKTYVRVNDFHPLLPAKLGAQCTCTSNTVALRRKPVTSVNRIIVEDDDDDDYAVDRNPVDFGERVVENYVFDAQRATPQIVSTEVPLASSSPPSYVVRKRLRVIRPVTTPKQQIFLKKSKAVSIVEDDPEALSAIKSTVKSAVSEALDEHNYDRFGHGGVRSRSDTLQGTVDCQRAGLFRHPQECNKFYACRWDCTKKRFTLHVFNCPVHLTFDPNLAACNWPSQGPACTGNTLLPNLV